MRLQGIPAMTRACSILVMASSQIVPWTSETLGAEGSAVAEVADALQKGASEQNLGNLDQADSRFGDVLRLDPSNKSARRAMEQGQQHRERYYEAARDQMRARALGVTDSLWEDPVPAVDLSHLFGSGGAESNLAVAAKENIRQKLRAIMVPLVDFDSVSLAEAVEYLRVRSRDLDPSRKGVSFVINASPEVREKTLTLRMTAVPVEEVLRQVTNLVGATYRVDDHAVVITSLADRLDAFVIRRYRVPPDFLQTSPAGPATAGLQLRRLGAQELLSERGVPFPPGAMASYSAATNVLNVRNTAENMVLVDALVDQAVNATARQVEIQVRMLEVTESRLKELGCDWLVGPFNVPGSDRIFGSGGGAGSTTGGLPFQGSPVTGGLRNAGNLASNALFSMPTLEGFMKQMQGGGAASPGAFAVSGVLTDPQFQLVVRAIGQTGGKDVLASPSIFAKSGQRSTVQVTREFRYPSEYDSAQVPQSAASGGPVTPSTPTEFEKRDVGLTLEVEPVLGDNGVVEMNLVPSMVEFEGFIDYGDEITNSIPTGLFGLGPPLFYNVPNQVLQPLFRTSRVSTTVSVWSGNTVVLGGVSFSRSQKIDDKVPVIGDLPLVGRGFQSKAGMTERCCILFFVTVHVVDPGGNRIATSSLSAARR